MTINTDVWTWMVDGDIPVIQKIFGLFPCVMWHYFATHTHKQMLHALILGPDHF